MQPISYINITFEGGGGSTPENLKKHDLEITVDLKGPRRRPKAYAQIGHTCHINVGGKHE